MRHEFSNPQAVVIGAGAPSIIESTIVVTGADGHIRDVNVTIDVEHTWTNDLRIHLEAPDGTRVLLVAGEGGNGDNFRRTTFDDASMTPVRGGEAPFRGTFRPEESLTKLNEHEANGTWKLRVEDRAFQDGGRLNQWSLSIETCNYCFTNSTPIVIDPGPQNVIRSRIQTPDLGGMVIDDVRVLVDLDHSFTNDLRISLTSPEGTTVVLVDREGGDGDNFDRAMFDDAATAPIVGASAPFRGTFRPEQPLMAFEEQLANGTWTLEIADLASQDGGQLNEWQLHFELRPAQPRVPSEFNIDVRFVGGLTANQRSVFQFAAARWSEIIIGDLPSVQLQGEEIDDLLILAEGQNIDGPRGILGQAGPRFVRSDSQLPVQGNMTFDSADLADLEADGSLIDVIIHEMGHVLGIGTLWNALGLIGRTGTDDPVLTGANAMREYATLVGANTPQEVPIANTGGPGTREGHWRESTFVNELLTGFINAGVNPVSRMTIASLQDLGYEVNLDAADPYQLPGAGVAAVMAGEGHACASTCPVIEKVPVRPLVGGEV